MSDIKLFRVVDDTVMELEGNSVAVEKSLQTLIEKHLDIFLGIRFLASEYSTGKTHRGRIDTLGIDENMCPVIIEYKRALNENVINQGLYYLDWLLDHKAEFTLMVMKLLGEKSADGIEWSSPRLLCIAGDFTKYDVHAVQQINRNIELIRYRRHGNDMILFELVNATTAQAELNIETEKETKQKDKTVAKNLVHSKDLIKDYFETLKAFLLALGDDVQMKELKHYFAFKRLKNFACVEIHTGKILAYVKVNPETIDLVQGFTRDMCSISHWGTGDLEITIRSDHDLKLAEPLFIKSYEVS